MKLARSCGTHDLAWVARCGLSIFVCSFPSAATTFCGGSGSSGVDLLEGDAAVRLAVLEALVLPPE